MINTINTSFVVPAALQDLIELAILRVENLFPEIEFKSDGDSIAFETLDKEMASRVKLELSNALYRQKIYRETRSIREALYSK